MSSDRPVLVRCASCQRNFETTKFGQISCPICRTKIYLEAPADSMSGDPAQAQEQTTAKEPAALDTGPQLKPEPRAADLQPEQTEQTEQPEPPEQADPEKQGLENLRSLLEVQQQSIAAGERQFLPAWESGQAGIFKRFADTFKQIFANPTWFFSNIKIDKYRKALSFAWIVCSLAVVFFALYSLWQLEKNTSAVIEKAALQSGEDPQKIYESLRSFLFISLYGAPIFGLINILISAFVYHMGIKLTANKHQGFKATFRATAYGFAPLVLVVVPFIGHLVGTLWALILQIIGLTQVHQITPARASLAVLLPVTAMMLIVYALFS
jgi:uncharacterized Zn finger protein (UPF0148 family)